MFGFKTANDAKNSISKMEWIALLAIVTGVGAGCGRRLEVAKLPIGPPPQILTPQPPATQSPDGKGNGSNGGGTGNGSGNGGGSGSGNGTGVIGGGGSDKGNGSNGGGAGNGGSGGSTLQCVTAPPTPIDPLLIDCLKNSGTGCEPSERETAYFLSYLYQSVGGLHRPSPPAANEVVKWLENLRSGTDRANVVKFIVESTENKRRKIAEIYTTLLGRPAGSEEITDWLSKSGNVELIAIQIAGSEEYFQRSGKNPAAFIRSIFREFLGREPSVDELIAWVGTLSDHTRNQIAALVRTSPEARTRDIRNTYQSVLGRSPLREEVERWSGFFAGTNNTRENLESAVFASNEAFSFAQPRTVCR